MSRTDAERSLRIYKQFVERTNEVIEYLSEAKSLEHAMRLQVPNVKHVQLVLSRYLISGSHGIDKCTGGISE
jgi:phosphatidylinositol-binding clathrin assembly protein